MHDGFAITFWTYYAVGRDCAGAYVDALLRIHAGLRQIDLAAPHINVRLAGWAAEVDDPAQTPDLPDSDRDFLRSTFSCARSAISKWETKDQLLHGEPHPGNLLNTNQGPIFIDLQTCQRGPIEYDLAFVPEEAALLYPGANQELVHQFRILNWAGFTTMRWRATDQFPDQAYWRGEGFNRLRTVLDLDG
ncbi:MAG: phosphotransferase [Caldilineaceae bacterium]